MIVTQWGLQMRRGVPLVFISLRVCILIFQSFAFPATSVVGAEEGNGKICSVKRARRSAKLCSYDDIKIIESST